MEGGRGRGARIVTTKGEQGMWSTFSGGPKCLFNDCWKSAPVAGIVEGHLVSACEEHAERPEFERLVPVSNVDHELEAAGGWVDGPPTKTGECIIESPSGVQFREIHERPPSAEHPAIRHFYVVPSPDKEVVAGYRKISSLSELEDGWYWWKFMPNSKPECEEVRGGLRQDMCGAFTGCDFKGEWWGPIPTGEELEELQEELRRYKFYFEEGLGPEDLKDTNPYKEGGYPQ